MIEALYAPRNRFLALLARGWRLPFVVEPMPAHHGAYSVLLERAAVDGERLRQGTACSGRGGV